MIPALLGLALLLLVLTFLVALLETNVMGLPLVSLRALAEKDREKNVPLLAEIAHHRGQFVFPLHFALLLLAILFVLVVHTLVELSGVSNPTLWTLVGAATGLTLARQLVPRFLVHTDPERLLLWMLRFCGRGYRFLQLLSSPATLLLRLGLHLLPRGDKAVEADEPSEAEIQAFLDVGEEVGIFEEQETDLIQSALEFGSTLVREIMTPRTEIVAIEDTASLAELKDLIVSEKYSRIPVFHDRLDHIVGIVYVRNLLSYLEQGEGDGPITPLVKRAWFVPETKKVAQLLKEMQTNKDPIAIVVNEYGAVSGLVTIEDLLEEIVGEIYDEDESSTVDIQPQEDGALLVRGGVDFEDLEEALGVDLGEPASTTVSGLVVDHLGDVPRSGETVEVAGLWFEILDADRKRIHWMKVRKPSKDPGESEEEIRELPAGS